jgi:lysophospholipase
MEFAALPENPIPDGIVAQPVVTPDGVRLRSAYWRPVGPTKGTVCLFPGRAESIDRYFEVVRELLARRFAVAAMDWRGQGGSERRLRNPDKGHVDDFDEYERDLEAFHQQVVLPDCPPPYFALAHSTGALVCLRVARRSRLTFARMVLTSPLIDFGSLAPSRRLVRLAAGSLSLLGLGDAWPPGAALARVEAKGFDGNPLTGDRSRFDRNRAIARAMPRLTIGPPTIGWIHAACRAMDEAGTPEFPASVRIPTLIVVGGEDGIVSPLAIERFVREMRLGSQIVIPGARHEVLMERDPLRGLFWAAFDAFVPGSEV